MDSDWLDQSYSPLYYMLNRPTSRRRETAALSSFAASFSTKQTNPVAVTGLRKPNQIGIRDEQTREVNNLIYYIKDHNYYKRIINAKIKEIKKEINRLKEEYNSNLKIQRNMSVYINKVRSTAEKLTNSQDILADYCIVVDKFTSNIDLNMLLHESENFEMNNYIEMTLIEKILADKHKRQKEIETLENQFKSECEMKEKFISEMEPKFQITYKNLKNQLKTYYSQIEQYKNKMKDLNEEKSILKEIIGTNSRKTECLYYETRLSELNKKFEISRENLEYSNEENSYDVFKKIKQENEQISIMERNINDLLKDINRLGNDISKENNEEDKKKSNENYIELKKEELIEESLEKIKCLKIKETEKWENKSREILEILELWKKRLGSVPNFQDLFHQDHSMNSQLISPQSIEDKHKNLLRILNKIYQMIKNIEDNLFMLDKRSEEIKKNIEEYTSFNNLTNDIQKRNENLEEMKTVLKARENEIRNKLKNQSLILNLLSKKLSENEKYQKIYFEEQKLKFLGEYNFELNESIKIFKENEINNYYKEMALKEVKEINDILRNSLRRRH